MVIIPSIVPPVVPLVWGSTPRIVSVWYIRLLVEPVVFIKPSVDTAVQNTDILLPCMSSLYYLCVSYFDSNEILLLTLLTLVTPEEPITGELNAEHCFLRTSEFTNNPRINQFVTGVITHNDSFTNLDLKIDPLVKVTIFFTRKRNFYFLFNTIFIGDIITQLYDVRYPCPRPNPCIGG